MVDAVGNVGFVSSFATFPLHFFDEERGLCVFEFPPMSSFARVQTRRRDARRDRVLSVEEWRAERTCS